MASNLIMIHKLQQAINSRGGRILYSSSQFFSDEQQRPITIYYVKKSVPNEKTGRNTNIELFKSTSQIQIVLFLRDMWYEINGMEIPNDNEEWNRIKNSTMERKE